MTRTNSAQQFGALLRESAAGLRDNQPPPGASRTAASQRSEKVRPKYTAIRDDQWSDLDGLARELMDVRTAKGRRITSNSLIRVAIDALLAQRNRLNGNDEEEIRANYLRELGVQD